MHPFNLGSALRGAKLVNRKGKPVQGFHDCEDGTEYPFEAEGENAHGVSWNYDGCELSKLSPSPNDLFMVNEPNE